MATTFKYRRREQRKLFRERYAYCACICDSCNQSRHCRNSFKGCMVPTYMDKA